MAFQDTANGADPTEGMTRGAAKPAPPPIREPSGVTPLKELRESLTRDQNRIVTSLRNNFERFIIEKLPEVTDSVQTSARQASVTTTVDFNADKKNAKRIKVRMHPRMRSAGETVEIDLHVNDEGQLALGFGPDADADDDAEVDE